MKTTQWAALTLTLNVSAIGSAHALQGGDPNDLDSCYAKCGDARGTDGLRCACDAQCEAFGDCCADRGEWCAPAAVNPVCALVDETKRYSRVCGTDLGFTFVHDNQLEIMFGDTWQYASESATSCSDPGLLGVRGVFNDDAQAIFASGLAAPSWLPASAAAARPDGGSCPSVLDFDRSAAAAPYTFSPMTLRDETGKDLALGLSNTPLTAFSDGKTAFALFGRGGADARRAYLARRDANVRTLYHVMVDFGHDTFLHNPSAARVTSETNYAAPTDAAPSVLYLWGRPRFGSSDAESVATNGVYLTRARLPFYDPATGKGRFAPAYFIGLDPVTRAPRWSQSAADARPVFTEDFKRVNQIDVKWIAELGKWVMLYGGDIGDGLAPLTVNDQPRHGAIHLRMADHPWGPWTRPTPLLWREHVPWWFQCDAYDDTQPRGCDRKNLRAPYYSPGDWEPQDTAFRGAQCRTDHPKPTAMPNVNFPFPFCASMSQRGNLYAPNIIAPWTRKGSVDPATGMASTTIYFVVSTWYPYDVVLAAADLRLPDYAYEAGRLQVREVGGRMIAVDASGAVGLSNVAGGGAGSATAFRLAQAGGSKGMPKIGDRVVLKSVRGSKVLSRQDRVLVAGERTEDSVLVLESADPSAPVGTQIAVGATPFRLVFASTLASTPLRVAAGAKGLRLEEGTSADGVFRFSDGCLKGDVCEARPSQK